MHHKPPYLQARGEYWDKQRLRTLVRDDFTCQFAQLGLTPIEGGCNHATPETGLRFLHIHHLMPRTHFLPHQIEGHDLTNLLTICRAHHAELHPHMRLELYMPGHYAGDDDGSYGNREL